jgi:hypothetical protein
MKKGKSGIKNTAKPKTKKTSGARLKASQKRSLEGQGKKIGDAIGRAEKGEPRGFGIGP